MCGIVGLYSQHEAKDIENLLGQMNGSQVHRGPDGEGHFFDPARDFGMAMRRLAIIDIAGGLQPMSQGQFHLVFNGEIFNAPELRKKLVEAGEVFQSDHSDTEVLLKLLVRERENALPQLNGMFAFCFYDQLKGEFLLARDRLGIKPLYYFSSPQRFAFASELKSLLTLPFISRDVDRQSLFNYLSLMYVPGPDSIIANVKKLPPGHFLKWKMTSQSIELRRWWQPRFSPDKNLNREDWKSKISGTLEKSVDRWALSDVPVACSLSGGLDSSSIVGFLAQKGHKVATYSLGFEGEDEKAWDELELAKEVSKKWGTDHHEIRMNPESLLTDLMQMVWSLDEPYGGGLPSWAVFKQMSQNYKVGLTGIGGDELFGHYGKWTDLVKWWKQIGRDKEESFKTSFFDRYYYFPDDEKRKVLCGTDDFHPTSKILFSRFKNFSTSDDIDRCAGLELQNQLTDEFLAMADRFSMAHGLEVRTPFLDNEMIDLALTIPSSLRSARSDLKGLLRDAVAPVLPSRLLSAPKKGFVIPLKLWLKKELKILAATLLSPPRLKSQGIFRPDLYEHTFQPLLKSDRDHTTRLWGLLMFQLWHYQYIEGHRDLKITSSKNFPQEAFV